MKTTNQSYERSIRALGVIMAFIAVGAFLIGFLLMTLCAIVQITQALQGWP